MLTGLLAYGGLFVVALLSATILPLQSEAVLTGLLLSEDYTPWLLVLVASVGNVLGSVINWWLGFYFARFEGRRWFPIQRPALARATHWYERYGKWSLLLSWVPIVGDQIGRASCRERV